MKSWHAPLVIAGMVAALAAAFAIGGPRAAMPVGAALILTVIIVAVRQKPVEAISPPKSGSPNASVLVVAAAPAEDGATVQAVTDHIYEAQARSTAGDDDWADQVEVVVLAPARIGFADRWASDVSRARDRAQRNLVITIASLAKSGIDAEANVGDADIEQAVEDFLRDHPATDVVLVTGPREEDSAGEKSYEALARRLKVPMTRVIAH